MGCSRQSVDAYEHGPPHRCGLHKAPTNQMLIFPFHSHPAHVPRHSPSMHTPAHVPRRHTTHRPIMPPNTRWLTALPSHTMRPAASLVRCALLDRILQFYTEDVIASYTCSFEALACL